MATHDEIPPRRADVDPPRAPYDTSPPRTGANRWYMIIGAVVLLALIYFLTMGRGPAPEAVRPTQPPVTNEMREPAPAPGTTMPSPGATPEVTPAPTPAPAPTTPAPAN